MAANGCGRSLSNALAESRLVSFPEVWKFYPNDLQPGDMDQEAVDILREAARLQEEVKLRGFGLSTPFNRTIIGRCLND